MIPTWDPLLSFKKMDHFPKAKWTASGHPSAGTRRRFGKASGTGYNQHFLQLCPIASLLTPFCFLFFSDMRKPDIGSTVLISWGIWSTGPLACSLCWLFCHRFLHDWFPWQQRRCRPKQKTSWQCLWAETHEAEHLAKPVSTVQLNETQWDSMTSTLLPAVQLL